MGSQLIRLFVAVTVPPSHLDVIEREIRPFRDKVTNARWTAPENQHLTLKFLGPTPVDRLEQVEKVCAIAAAGRAPAPVSLTDVGGFPSRSRIRVLWVGVDDPAGLLAGLAADLDRAFEPLGYAAEARPFTAHLTLARFKIPVPLKGGLPTLDLSGLAPFVVDRIELYRSHLSPKGARYERLSDFVLSTDRPPR